MKNLMIVVAAGLAISAEAVEIPASVSGCTNFVTCAQNVRNDFVNTAKKCAAEGDMATFGKLIDRLAKEKVDGNVFQMWQQTANGLVDAGLAQKKKKPEEQKTLMAGFREGGTTFGLWQGAEEIGKTPDKAFGTAAVNLLKRKMPQQGLSSALQFRRDQTVLGIMNRIGTESDKVAAAAPVRALAFSIKPVTRDDTNAVFDAANPTCNFLLERGKNAEYAAFAKEFRTKRTDIVKGETAKKWMARELGGYARVPDEKAFAALKAEFAKLPVDRELLGALNEFRNTVTQRIWPGLWDRVADVARPFINGRGAFKGVERMLADEFSLNLASSLNDIATMKRDYASILAIAADVDKRWEAENAREKAAREVEQISRKNNLKCEPFKRDPSVERPNPWIVNNARGVFIRKMNEVGDWAAAVPEMEKNLNVRNPNGYWDLAVACSKVGKDHRAIELCDQLLGEELKARPEQKADAKALKAWISATDEKDLVQRLNALRIPERRERAMACLEAVEMADAARKLPSEISGGMRKRAAIARALALEPEVIFLDEPSAGLDPITSCALDELILKLKEETKKTFVVVTHELPSIFKIADRCAMFDRERHAMVALGKPSELRDSSTDPFVRRFFNRGL